MQFTLKNYILIAKLYYLFLPLIRVIKFPITISRFFIRTFIKDYIKLLFQLFKAHYLYKLSAKRVA